MLPKSIKYTSQIGVFNLEPPFLAAIASMDSSGAEESGVLTIAEPVETMKACEGSFLGDTLTIPSAA